MNKSEKLKRYIDERTQDVEASKQSIIDNFRIGVIGGVLAGIGGVAEPIGLEIGRIEVNGIGAMAIVMGGLMVKSAYNDIKERTNLALEDNTKASLAQTSLESSDA